ncbi:hypothetical protein A6R68_12658, partial [Neotoma lepida]
RLPCTAEMRLLSLSGTRLGTKRHVSRAHPRTRARTHGNELNEVVIEGNASLSIEDGRMGISEKVRGDHLGDNFKDKCSRVRTSRSPDLTLRPHCHSFIWHIE